VLDLRDADGGEAVAPVIDLPRPVPATVAPSRDEASSALRALYAEALEYPEEVFTDDVELEADLGIDSVKQTELLARAAESYGMPARDDDFRLADYDTFGKVVDYVVAQIAGAPAELDRRVSA
jgi:[acyl-carrier-protein] S-malonyltransferase